MTNTSVRGDANDLLWHIYRETTHASEIDVDESGGIVYHRRRPLCIVYFITVDGHSWGLFNNANDYNTFEEFKEWCSSKIKSIEDGRPAVKIVHLSVSSRDEEMTPWNDGKGVDLSGYLSNS